MPLLTSRPMSPRKVTEKQRPIRPQVRALPRTQRSSVSSSVALRFLHFGFLGSGLVHVLLVLLTSPMSLFFPFHSEHRRQANGPLSRRRGISCIRFSYRSAEASRDRCPTRYTERPVQQLQGGPFRRSQPLMTLRTAPSPNDIATVTAPSSPTKGRCVPVFGKVDAICSRRYGEGCSAPAEGPGAAEGGSKSRASTGDAGGGVWPTTDLLRSITVSVSSVMMVASKDIPFLRSNAVFFSPSIVNFAWFGIL